MPQMAARWEQPVALLLANNRVQLLTAGVHAGLSQRTCCCLTLDCCCRLACAACCGSVGYADMNTHILDATWFISPTLCAVTQVPQLCLRGAVCLQPGVWITMQSAAARASLATRMLRVPCTVGSKTCCTYAWWHRFRATPGAPATEDLAADGTAQIWWLQVPRIEAPWYITQQHLAIVVV
jgi:hypothetical protein